MVKKCVCVCIGVGVIFILGLLHGSHTHRQKSYKYSIHRLEIYTYAYVLNSIKIDKELFYFT